MLFYIGIHGAFVLALTEFVQGIAMKWTHRIHPHWLSYVVVMIIGAALASCWWKIVNVAVAKAGASTSTPPSPAPIADSPHTDLPKVTHGPAPITKIEKFATIVPFDPINKNVPIPARDSQR
jgi:hypothetical protein